MKIYNNQEEVEKDVVNWVLKIYDDITFTFDLEIGIDIIAYNIYAKNMFVGNIAAIKIDANHIDYYAVCFAYKTFRCKSIKGNRKNSKHFCLDWEIEIKE